MVPADLPIERIGILSVAILMFVSAIAFLGLVLRHLWRGDPFEIHVRNTSLGGVAGGYRATPALVAAFGLLLTLGLLAGVTLPWRSASTAKESTKAPANPCPAPIQIEGSGFSVATPKPPAP
jgi:hypothetical protein